MSPTSKNRSTIEPPTDVAAIPTPALLLDVDVLDRNLRRMADRATSLGISLRPHVKTHKCVEIARRQRELGARGITVSTLEEARVFARHGFSDCTWASPLTLARTEEAMALSRSVQLGLTVDSHDALDAIEAAREQSQSPSGGSAVWLKVDCGYGRAGVEPESPAAVELAARIARSNGLDFRGILTHSGQAYHCARPEEIAGVAERERATAAGFARRLEAAGILCPGRSVGSTPAMAHATSLAGVTEARPGNYALYDHTQVVLGSCEVQDCAVTVLASVVSSQPGASHCVIDAGALALSKDLGRDVPAHFGHIFDEYSEARLNPELRVASVSQEHGVLNHPLTPGARVRILPNHACLTVAQFDRFHVVQGDEVVGVWSIWRDR